MAFVRLPEIVNLGDFTEATSYERCGVIAVWGSGNENAYVLECSNAAPDPERDYAITQDDYEACAQIATDQGMTVLGFFHTHPEWANNTPTAHDFAGASLHPEFVNAVYHVATRALTWYNDEQVLTRG